MAVEWRQFETGFAWRLGGDGYVEWALGAAGSSSYFGPQHDAWASVSVQYRGCSAVELAAGTPLGLGADWASQVRVPAEYLTPPPGIPECDQDGTGYLMMLMRSSALYELVKSDFAATSEVLQGMRIGRPLPPGNVGEDSGSEPGGPGDAAAKGPPPRVVTGVVDDALAFLHDRFRLPGNAGTRIDSMWWQDGDPDGSAPFGRARTRADIDTWLTGGGQAGILDEDEAYRREGLLDFSRSGRNAGALRLGHGTHVMDIACGYPPDRAPADRPVVAVQLPARVTADASLHSLNFPDPFLGHAVLWILWRAHRLATGGRELPVVINFSYGDLAGPHDGLSAIERELDFYIRSRRLLAPLEIVLPAGNGHLARSHAAVSFDAGAPRQQTLRWRILPDDRTWSFLEIWMPPDGEDQGSRMSVSVATPHGLACAPLAEDPLEGRVLVYPAAPDRPLCTLTYSRRRAPDRRGMFLLAVRHTASFEAQDRVAPSGHWVVTLHNAGLGPDQEVHCWVERDDTPYGYRVQGRQSYLDEDCYRVHDHGGRPIETDRAGCPVRRANSMSALATGHETVVVGGFHAREGKLARYSPGGPVGAPAAGGPHHSAPDAVAVSEASGAHRGVIAAGTRSGSAVALQGTSVAAPQAARAIADQLASNPAGPDGRTTIRQRAQADDANFPVAPARPPERLGDGRLDVALPGRMRRFER